MNTSRFASGVSIGALLAVGLLTAQTAPPSAQAAPAQGEILAAFHVYEGQLFDLPSDLPDGGPVTAFIPLDDATHELRLDPYSVRGPHYRVIRAAGDGSYTDVAPGPLTTYRGSVAGEDGSVAAASILPQGLFARLILGDGREFWIEPVSSKLPDAPAGLHIAYRTEDSYAEAGQCANSHETIESFRSDPFRTADPPCVVGTCVAEVAFDTDFEFNARYGTGAEDRANLILNAVNIQFERDVHIHLVISAIILRTTEPDPYDSLSPGIVLSEMKIQWQSFHTDVHRDIAQLLAGRDILSPYIGQSYNSSVCDDPHTGQGYSLVETDYNNSWPHTTDLTAHELGHTFGATHCPCHVSGDPSSDWTMNAGITGANRFHPTYSIPEITNFLATISCVEPFLPPQDTATSLPIHDTFDSVVMDANVWTAVIGPHVNDVAINEPSPPYSLNLDGNALGGDEIRTGIIDMTTIPPGSFVLEYDWEQKGGGENPDSGENLWVEYFDTDGFWSPLNIHFRTATPANSFTHAFVDWLPEDQYHAGFRIRFRVRESHDVDQDDWFVDNVHMYSTATGGACCASGACSEVDSAEACHPFVCDVHNHLPPSFTGCYGDADGNGIVNPGDRGFVAASIGSTDPATMCLYDMDGNGFINPGDRGYIAVNIGLCTPLPDFQNGSGMNHGAPDAHFGTASFQGAGTSCATTACP